MQTAEDFATVAAKVVPGVNVIPLMQIDWNQAKDVPGRDSSRLFPKE